MGNCNMWHYLPHLTSLVTALFTASTVSPSQVEHIGGKGTDEGDNPVPFANVVVKHTLGGAAARADGTYWTAGTLEAQARAIGSQTTTQSVEVLAGETVTLNFILLTDMLRMDAVVVSGTPKGAGVPKPDASFATTTMGVSDIELFHPSNTA